MKNVHEFDGLLKNKYTPSKLFSKEEKIKLFKHFTERSEDNEAISMVRIMLSDFLIGINKDNANLIDWSNLFADILSHKGLDDVFSFLEEQLSDARRMGPCAQGRSTRLLQIWTAMQFSN